MMLSSNGIICTVKDHANRPLVVLKRLKNGKILYILNRYIDMTEKDKDIARVSHSVALKTSNQNRVEDLNIEDFLSFSDNKPCG